MGFYGNITNTARTQFQFDRIYTSRKIMDESATTDGIYAGRYVLVNYEEDGGWDYYLHAYKSVGSNGFEFGASYNMEGITKFKWVSSIYEADPDNDLVYEGQIIVIPPDGMHNLADPNSEKWEFWKVQGFTEVTQESETEGEDSVVVKYADFIQFSDSYAVNYNEDVEKYGTSRGYDSTVWQKTYQNGEDKYVMIAELNTIVPTFDIEADAPKMVPLTPHFDADSTNVYYKLHWSANWGFRVKAANPELEGPILRNTGADTTGYTKMSSDKTLYPSDEKASWYKTEYDGLNTINNYVFTVGDKNSNNGRWIPIEEENRNEDEYGRPEEAIGPPAAIYYNKDGFNPEIVSYGYFEKSLDSETYEPYIYYVKHNGIYSLADDLEFDINETYYEKIEDHIRIEPTGFSGHMYNRHDGTITDSVQEDTQELSIMLPALGNTISAVWDMIYGSEEINDGPRRNLDIAWERARAGMDRHGLRLVNDYDFGGQYLYKTKNVETIAGALNSVYDLLGMIITSGSNDDLMNNIDELSDYRIYYDQTNHTFNRRHKIYTYTPLKDKDTIEYNEVNITALDYIADTYYIEISEGVYELDNSVEFDPLKTYYSQTIIPADYSYEPVTVVTPDEEYEYSNIPGYSHAYVPGYYYILENGEYVVCNDVEFDENKTYYLRTLEKGAQYTEESGFTLFDGMTYCYPDFVGTDEALYQYEEITLNSNSYIPNNFYIYEDSNYIRDNSPDFSFDKTYYRRTSNFNPLKMDYVRDPKYQRNRTYYRWDEIEKTTHLDLSDIYEKNKFFYKDEQGNYILSRKDKAQTDVQYYSLIEENVTSLSSFFMQNQEYGIYVPGKYLYQTKDGDFKLAVEPTLSKSILYEQPEGLVYYQLDTSGQTTLDNKVYNRVITFEEIPQGGLIDNGINYYTKGTYWLLRDGATYGSQKESDYRRCDDDYYDENKTYYIKNETLYLVSNNYYKVDMSHEFSLIQFHKNEFFYKDGTDYKVITELADTAILTGQNVDIVVLRNTENLHGHYALMENEGDFSNPAVSAMIYQDKFYEAGRFHYEADDLFDGYTDYILDTYPRKKHNIYYTLSHVGNPVNLKFFEAYRYYQQNPTTGEYELITDDSVLPNGTIYSKNGLYVIHDNAHIYSDGAEWNFDAKYIPAPLTLGKRSESFGLEPFTDFARNLGTMHGMILKIKSMLEYDDQDTRDLRSVQGALHTLQDKIAQFSTWKPGQVMIADDYGRLHGANRIETEWTIINVDSQVGTPTINIEHKYNRDTSRDTAPTPDLSINRDAKIIDITPEIDGTGHVVAWKTKTTSLPDSYGIVGADNTTFTPNNESNVNDIPAEITYEAIKFEGTDQWIQTATAREVENAGTANEVTVKKIKFTHEYNRDTSRDQTPTPNLSLNADAKITDHYPQLDAMGHVVAWIDTTYDLPDSYGIVGADNTTFTPNNANNINDIAAGTTYQAIKFEGTDDWIQTATATETEGEGANAVSVKKIKFTHEYNRDTSRDVTTNVNLATSTTAAFTDWKPLLDANGHVVAWENSPITFPNGYSQFTGDSGSSQAADTYDSFKIEGSTWIQTAVDGSNQKVILTHKAPVVTGAHAYGETTAQTPAFGATFSVPSFSIDDTGHISVVGDHTVTVPSLSLISGNATLVTSNLSNVVTGLTYEAGTNSGTFTKTESAIKDLLLTGYSATAITRANLTTIAASDSIGAALNKLEKRASYAQDSADEANAAIAALDMTVVTAGAGEVIDTVSQLNGQVSVTKKNLITETFTYDTNKTTSIATIAETIDTLNTTVNGLNYFDNATTFESDGEDWTIDDIITRLKALETE